MGRRPAMIASGGARSRCRRSASITNNRPVVRSRRRTTNPGMTISPQGVERPRPWFWPVAMAAAVNAAILLVYGVIYFRDPSALVCADAERIGRWPFEAVKIGFPTHGFDGQFYYVLARYPLHPPVEFLDAAAYRHARIVYPALAWSLTGGDPDRLLWVLPAINWLALVGLAWLGANVAGHYGRSPWWGAALPFILNVTPAALRDLADPVATLATCAVVSAWLLEWRAWTFAPLCTLALLSREQSLVIVLLVALEAGLKRHFRIPAFIAI